MLIKAPCEITSRLLPGLRVGGATISIEYADSGKGHRQGYRWFIDLTDGQEFTGDDLSTGCQHSLQSALESLLSFLSACGESFAYAQRRGIDPSETENADLFPLPVAEWAAQNSDELSMAAIELEETKGIIAE